VVPPASHRVPRAPWYSGYRFPTVCISPTGLSPPTVCRSMHVRLYIQRGTYAVLQPRTYHTAHITSPLRTVSPLPPYRGKMLCILPPPLLGKDVIGFAELRSAATINCRLGLCALWYARFGLFPVRSPLLRESHLISLPPGTEMFHFPGSRFVHLWIQCTMIPYDRDQVSPFGFPRIIACSQLPVDFRSLPRPSSPPDA
jgi:hypothetical protein